MMLTADVTAADVAEKKEENNREFSLSLALSLFLIWHKIFEQQQNPQKAYVFVIILIELDDNEME